MLLCDYADSHEQDVIFQWTDRVMSSGVNFSESASKNLVLYCIEGLVEASAPLITCAHFGIGNDSVNITIGAEVLNYCYLDALDHCDGVIQGEPISFMSPCTSSMAVNVNVYADGYYIELHVLPSVKYMFTSEDNVTYTTSANATQCVDNFNDSSLIAYDYLTHVCMSISTKLIDTTRLTETTTLPCFS
ncbi:hypothetical protein EB796_019820 [Bugula neritina]|uniref:Uncharacterized protein n=1 Tax=Bugula neritina TaxID=10212 RepID=A0A7J7J8G4_BUGNE|nr:hypothetical protein EB796_019820 [Bugula neritina]